MSSSIDQIKLNDGSSIPWLAFGNGTGNAKKLALDSTTAALNDGIYHIDTAQIYQTEEATAEAIQQAGLDRSKLFITSKIATPHGSEAEIRKGIESSLEKLQSVPDLFLIHNPFIGGNEDRVVPTWKVMEDMKDEGKLKSIGVSNFRPQDFEKLLRECRYKPAAHQLEFHPMVLNHLKPVLDIHKEHNIVLESYGPLTPTLRYPKDKQNPLKPVLEKIAQRMTKETAQEVNVHDVLLLWIKAKGGIAVTASGNPDNIKGLAKTAYLKANLTPQEVSEIDDIGSQHHFRYYNEHMSTDFPPPSNVPKENVLQGRQN